MTTTKISGFTFVHNAIDSGYPIVEAIRAIQQYVDEVVVVDMQSTDRTREVLGVIQKANEIFKGSRADVLGMWQDNPPLKILDGFWGNQAGETLRQAHSKYIECSGDVIIHFEADEVFDESLIEWVAFLIEGGQTDIAVHRLQLEQNFQRCRWYPEPVHRVFPRLSNTRKEGHTTNRHDQAIVVGTQNGLLWDITNCFRDNWINRINKQAELRDEQPQYFMVPVHASLPAETDENKVKQWLCNGRYWTWKETPFKIPEILRPLVGRTKYEPNV